MATSSLAALAASSTKTGSSAASGSAGTIASNYQTFLNLLTTQLKNQSPLDPLDTNQFTQQLVQFASVEQQLKTNESLTSLLAASKASSTTGALGFVGTTITADGATTRLSGGNAAWSINAPRAVNSAVVTIKDATGSVVKSETRAFSAGLQTYSWNGKTSAGATAPDGEYTVNVSAADSSGNPLVFRTELVGAVDKVDVSGTEPLLRVGSVIIPLSKVKTIQRS